jgi:hypothetical protein
MTSYLPGNTLFPPEEKDSVTLIPLQRLNKVIILASNDVNDETLFLNGLTQNIIILYHLFESMGYTAYLLQHPTNNQTEKRAFIHQYRVISPQDMVKQPIPIAFFIEIGMSVDAMIRSYLRITGARIVKLYLGNILNIDIETIQNYKSMFFNHHSVGEIDEIWTSPHYYQHIDYCAILNRVDITKARVVPYVWDSCFLTRYGAKEMMEWIAPSQWQNTNIVIMDPNISFQKCYFYPLLLIQAFSKKYPEWRGKVHIINGDRIKLSANAYNRFLSALSIKDRVVLHPRKKIHAILEEYSSACFITHQWNNDYNYMTLELMYCNYPILHNSEGWNKYGYHYSVNEWENAVETLYGAIKNHKDNLPIYKLHAANLIAKHSIYHPTIQERWATILST